MSDLVNRLRELADAVTRGPDAVASEFTMSVPARPERDADLVLSAAANEIERLRAALEVVARHYNSDWPAPCRHSVLTARQALCWGLAFE